MDGGQLGQQARRLHIQGASIDQLDLHIDTHREAGVDIDGVQGARLGGQYVQMPQGLQMVLVVHGALGKAWRHGQQQTRSGDWIASQREVATAQKEHT